MVGVVVLPGEDQAPSLEPDDPARGRVHVGPLVELVRQKDGQADHEEERSEEVALGRGGDRDEEPDEEHGREARQAVVPVVVHEAVACDPLRVNVVVPERLDKVGAEDRGLLRAEVVGQEMDEPRGEVGGSGDGRQGLRVTEVGRTEVDLVPHQGREHEEGPDAG